MNSWRDMTEADLKKLGEASRRLPEAKPSKYKAVKTTVDGIVFDSKKEAKRYQELKLMEKAGRIRYLRTQVAFLLRAGRDNAAVGHYVADFCYEERSLAVPDWWEPIVEDAKGVRTAMYRWKAKHMLAEHGIRIRET